MTVCLPFVTQLAAATDNDLKNSDKVDEALGRFQSMIDATVESNVKVYEAFAQYL